MNALPLFTRILNSGMAFDALNTLHAMMLNAPPGYRLVIGTDGISLARVYIGTGELESIFKTWDATEAISLLQEHLATIHNRQEKAA